MTVSIEMSSCAENVLRKAFGDNLNRATLEAIVAEGYRTGKLSRYEVQNLLEFEDLWETESWLADRGVLLNYSLEDLEADRQTLQTTLPERP